MGVTHMLTTRSGSISRGVGSPAIGHSRWSKTYQVAETSGGLAAAVQTLELALQAKDPSTMAHSGRVRRFAVAMARQLGQSTLVAQEIALAAELHDIGKIGIPDELLHKAGPLSADECCRVLEHTIIGARILEPLMGNHPLVIAVVRWHHERADGSGYPDGLRAEQVPLVARIVGVADAFDAMTSERPYRTAYSFQAAAQELVRCSGTQFDGRCVQALLAVADRVEGP